MRWIHAVPVALVAVALAGCGGDGGDDEGSGGAGTTSGATTQTQAQTQARTTAPANGPDGAEVFASNCASCHTLAAADSNGNVGPNLDDLQPDFATTQSQVENGGGGMPAFGGDLSTEEIDAVARFVSENAGR